MNLKDAIESGKRFRHKYYREGVWEAANGEHVVPAGITWDQIFSNEWEVEQKKIEITESELERIAHEFNGCKGSLFDNVLEEWRQRLFGDKNGA